MLTSVFGTTIFIYKMASNEKVVYMKRLCIVDVNNFLVRVIVIRDCLKTKNYVPGNKTMEFSALFG